MPGRLLFVVTEDWYFWSHRRHMAVAAKEAGWQVAVATRVTAHGDRIRALGVDLLPIAWDRGGINPFRELRTAAAMRRCVREYRPDVVHNVALKPILHSNWCPAGPSLVNAVTGMGYLFTGGGRALGLRGIVQLCMRRALRQGRAVTVVQNDDDAALMRSVGVPEPRLRRIEGVGIDVEYFRALPEPESTEIDAPIRVALVARLLWDKGVAELVAAAELLRARGVRVVVELAGTPDPANRASIDEQQVRAWMDAGLVEWSGWCDDVRAVWARAHVAVLPSYREGLPKALLEAAACGRPMIATDVPGCRAVVEPGRNGLLVPRGDAAALADAIANLVDDANLRQDLGRGARASAEQRFSSTRVIRQFHALYDELLAARR